MINKPMGFDDVAAVIGGGRQLPAGGYVCRIVQTKATKSKAGRDMLVLALDIAEGEYKDFFLEKYNNKKAQNPDAKWGCNYYQLMDGDSMGRFKGLLSILEMSNPGFTIQWPLDEKSLIGKKLGGIFRNEQYIGNDNKPHDSMKCAFIDVADGIENAKVPEPKLIEQNSQQGAFGNSVGDEEIPF